MQLPSFMAALAAAAVLPLFGAAAAQSLEVRTPQFAVELPGANWEQLPLNRRATPWRYSRSLGADHTLFLAVTWIPLAGESGQPPPTKAQVAEDIIAEARRQAVEPGRKLLRWERSEERGLAEGEGCWRYASDFRLAVNAGEKIEYRSRGFICHVPAGDGLAWLRYDELKAAEAAWAPGYEAAAERLRESLRAAP